MPKRRPTSAVGYYDVDGAFHIDEDINSEKLWHACVDYELQAEVFTVQNYRVDGRCRVVIEPTLEALDKATLTLNKGDIVEGYEVTNSKNESWIYIPNWDRFIWYGSKVHHI